MKRFQIVSFIAIFFILGCKKEDNNIVSGGTQNSNTPPFNGYTATDITGVPMGLTDSTDWTTNDTWLTVEKELFDDYESFVNNCPLDSNLTVYPAYPNPTADLFFLTFVKDSSARFRIRIVNQQFDKLISADSIYSNNIAIDLNGLITSSDTMVRAYYMFVLNDSCLFKGHGDIKIN